MFSDKSSDVVGFTSCWKTERELEDKEVQTADCSYEVKESQSNVSINTETQTDNLQLNMMVPEDVDYDKLATFLRYVGPLVIKELDACQMSRAFESYEPLNDDIDNAVKKICDLQIPKFNILKDTCVSGLSWFCTGTSVACSYSVRIHRDWCDHTGWIHIFNINRSTISPTRTLEAMSCVSAVSAHPFEPSIIAAGLYTGEVLVWNLQKDDEPLICSSEAIPGSHKEPVTQLSWIPDGDTSQKRPLLVSTGCDGRMLIWKVGTYSGNFQLSEAFIITLERLRYLNLDMFMSPTVRLAETEISINCFSFSKMDPTCFVLGLHGGIILCCSTIAAKPALVDADIPFKDPVVKAFDRHQGAVSCVQWSPHRENKFISCAHDNEIHIYLLEQSSPIHIIHVEDGVVGMEWSLAYPQILVLWGNNKDTVEFYDLHIKAFVPSLQIPALEKSAEICAMQCHPQNQRLVAVGDMSARVIIWEVCSYNGE